MTEPFTATQARKSTLLVATVFAGLAAWQAYRGHELTMQVFGGLSAVLFVCAAIAPAALWFHKRWMALAGVLGFVNSRILLSIVYYLLLTPVGLAVRLSGHDPLERRKGRERSYWRQRPVTRQTREGFERSF